MPEEKGYTEFPSWPPIDPAPQRDRIGQQDLLPNAIKTRLLGNIVQLSSNATDGGTTLTAGGTDEVPYLITASNDPTSRIHGEQDVALYLTNDGTGSWQIGVGSNVNEANFQVIGPWNDWHLKNVAGNDPNFMRTRLYVRYLGAGSVTIYIHAQLRLITNTPSNN